MQFFKRGLRAWLFGALIFLSFPGFAGADLKRFCEGVFFTGKVILSGRARQIRYAIQKNLAGGQKEFQEQMAGQGYVFPSSRQSHELSAIRNDLDSKGYSLMKTRSRIDLQTAEKIRHLLHDKPFCSWSMICALGGVAPDIKAYGNDTLISPVTMGWSVWKRVALAHSEISEEEINQFHQDILELAHGIKKTIAEAETTAKRRTTGHQSIALHSIYVCTDNRWNCSPIGGHRHDEFIGTDLWGSASVSVFGPGTWFETENKRDGKRERAVARPGQVLLLSESKRNRKLSLTNELTFHGTPDLPHKRLILLMFYIGFDQTDVENLMRR